MHLFSYRSRKGFAPTILMFIVAALLVVSGGVYYLENQPSATSSVPVACTQEARQCSDGSYVSRVGPACEFSPCPTASTSSPQNGAFKESGSLSKKDSSWYVTVRKYDAQTDSWSEGPMVKLVFNDNSFCQRVTTQSKCLTFSLPNSFSTVQVEGTVTGGDTVLVSTLTLIQ